MEGQGRLTVGRKLAYGVGHILNDLCASMWFTYLLVYLQYVLQLERRTAGLLLLLGQVADAMSTPLVGLYSDRGCGAASCCTYGRRKTWHALGSVCVLASFPFIFVRCTECSSSPALYVTFIAIMICIFQFGWASVQVSHLALIPDLTRTEVERDELNIIRYFFDVSSDVLVYLVAWAVLREDLSPYSTTIDPTDDYNFMIVTVSILSVGVFFTILFHIFTPEPPSAPDRLPTPGDAEQPQAMLLPDKAETNQESSKPGTGTNPKKGMKVKKKLQAAKKQVKKLDEDDRDAVEEESTKKALLAGVTEVSAISSGSSSTTSLDEFDERWHEVEKKSPKNLNVTSDDDLLVDDRVQMRWKDWLSEPQFYQVSLLYTCARLVTNLSNIYMPVFLQETQHSTELIALVPLVMSLAGVVATVLLKTFRKCSGKKGSVLSAVFIGLLACLAVLFGGPSSSPSSAADAATDVKQLPQWAVYSVAALWGFSGSMLMILSLALTADMIGRCTESSAFVYGCMSFGDKLANGFVVVIVQEVASVSCSWGAPCGWFFQQLLGAGLAGALLVCGLGGASLAVGRLGYTNKMRRAREERGLLGSSHSPISSSDSSELLLPTTSQLGYGAIPTLTDGAV